jgi:hypothetical protein
MGAGKILCSIIVISSVILSVVYLFFTQQYIKFYDGISHIFVEYIYDGICHIFAKVVEYIYDGICHIFAKVVEYIYDGICFVARQVYDLLIKLFNILVEYFKFLDRFGCTDSRSSCAVLYCDLNSIFVSGECHQNENEIPGYDTISFLQAQELSNDSTTFKFVEELRSRNDLIRTKLITETDLSYLMLHKIQQIANGFQFGYDIQNSLLPLVAFTNSTGTVQMEVLYLDYSLADANLRFLALVNWMNFSFFCLNLIGTIGFFIWTLKYVSGEGSRWSEYDTVSLVVLLFNLCSNFVSMLLFVSIKFIFLDVIVYIAGLLMFWMIM